MNRQQSVVVGAFLIGLGIFWWLNLWWLLWPAVLAGAGVMAYRQRRQLGRTIEAVQAGIWLVGLAVLFLLHFVFPGVLFLAGASILIRGREYQVDDQIQSFVKGFATRRSAGRSSLPSQRVPVTTVPTGVEQTETSQTGETTRL